MNINIIINSIKLIYNNYYKVNKIKINIKYEFYKRF